MPEEEPSEAKEEDRSAGTAGELVERRNIKSGVAISGRAYGDEAAFRAMCARDVDTAGPFTTKASPAKKGKVVEKKLKKTEKTATEFGKKEKFNAPSLMRDTE
jgi:hypothetical protein